MTQFVFIKVLKIGNDKTKKQGVVIVLKFVNGTIIIFFL